MKSKIQAAIVLTGLVAFSAMAQEATKPAAKPPGPPDKEKVSYAQGMRIGQELKLSGADLDVDVVAKGIKDVLEGNPTRLKEPEVIALLNENRVSGLAAQAKEDKEKISYAMGMYRGLLLKRSAADLDTGLVAQGIKDVLAGKPTKVQESEIPALFKQAKAYGLAKQSSKNKTDGDAFLAKNAKEPGVKVSPSGLQYRVLKSGTGEIPSTNDLVFVKYRGTLIDGTEFDHKNHFLTRSSGGIKGWQEALQRMKAGSKWQLFVPSALGFGPQGDPFLHIGPDATLIYEMELLSVAQPGDPRIGTGRVGHGLDDDETPPNPVK
jgi:FKBP-type peptidyl-prolyl cis-trans isomerase FklB